MNFGMIALLVFTKLARGPGGGKESIFGFELCSTASWIFFVLLVVGSVLMTLLAAHIAKSEYATKQKLGYNFTKGDQKFENKILLKLATVAFFCALFAGATGIGPGLIFNSLLVQLDMHPASASATGMYCTLFTSLAATINVLINESLNLPFSLAINLLTLIGTLPGLYGQQWILRKSGGRTQFIVMILLAFLLLQLVTILPLSIVETMRASDEGEDVMAVKDFCS